MVSEKKASAVLKEFAEEYHLAEPYYQCVDGVGIRFRRTFRDGRKPGELEELCLIAFLRKPFPGNIKLPSDYKGIKVETQYISFPYIHWNNTG
jgi:hypothetical protein